MSALVSRSIHFFMPDSATSYPGGADPAKTRSRLDAVAANSLSALPHIAFPSNPSTLTPVSSTAQPALQIHLTSPPHFLRPLRPNPHIKYMLQNSSWMRRKAGHHDSADKDLPYLRVNSAREGKSETTSSFSALLLQTVTPSLKQLSEKSEAQHKAITSLSKELASIKTEKALSYAAVAAAAAKPPAPSVPKPKPPPLPSPSDERILVRFDGDVPSLFNAPYSEIVATVNKHLVSLSLPSVLYATKGSISKSTTSRSPPSQVDTPKM
ncbi:hypothetical protein R3P38DRAFT_3226164 [Favolaschia claudopus]|uniref:Uncharacterized protein n=1 Tax=Favolaschia claudopus TaxID=2862362 RepID=A0AAV9ZU43_9AGAR